MYSKCDSLASLKLSEDSENTPNKSINNYICTYKIFSNRLNSKSAFNIKLQIRD